MAGLFFWHSFVFVAWFFFPFWFWEVIPCSSFRSLVCNNLFLFVLHIISEIEPHPILRVRCTASFNHLIIVTKESLPLSLPEMEKSVLFILLTKFDLLGNICMQYNIFSAYLPSLLFLFHLSSSLNWKPLFESNWFHVNLSFAMSPSMITSFLFYIVEILLVQSCSISIYPTNSNFSINDWINSSNDHSGHPWW